VQNHFLQDFFQIYLLLINLSCNAAGPYFGF
jgi:hypothetical protein